MTVERYLLPTVGSDTNAPVSRRLARIAHAALSVWPWGWTLFFYFAGSVAA